MDEIKEQAKDEKNLKLLGSGSFGKVYKLEFKGKDYAIKKISKDNLENNKVPELGEYLKIALKREIDILSKMSEFENSIKFYGYFTDDKDYILVLEYCDSDLQKLLKEKQKFSSSEIRTIMEGLNKPFKYIRKIYKDIMKFIHHNNPYFTNSNKRFIGISIYLDIILIIYLIKF